MKGPWPQVAHGADLARARSLYGEPSPGWLDLSTGINPRGWPVGDALARLDAGVWRQLPSPDQAVLESFERYYGPGTRPVAGSQAAIQALPRVWRRLRGTARVDVQAPAYGEHAARWALEGHEVRCRPLDELGGSRPDVIVVVQPNNPTGERCGEARLRELAAACDLLVIDAAFADACDEGCTGRAEGMPRNAVVLHSVGKFFGLAGLRIGAVTALQPWGDALQAELGPWAVNGPGLQLAAAALQDVAWQQAARRWLAGQALALGEALARHGLAHEGTMLFRTVCIEHARPLHEGLARAGIWTRLFDLGEPVPYRALRFGLPADEAGLRRLDAALDAVSKNLEMDR